MKLDTKGTVKPNAKNRHMQTAGCVLAVVLSLSLVACSSTPAAPTVPDVPVALAMSAEANGFDSPEDAVRAYLEGLRDADLNRMIDAFAVKAYVENYDFEAYLNKVQVYSHISDIRLPNANEFVTVLNAESYRSDIISTIFWQYVFLCDPEFNPDEIVNFDDEASVRDFVSRLDSMLNTPNLQTLKLLGFLLPETLNETYSSERNLSVMAENAASVGADKLVSCVAVFELDGKRYILLLDAVGYGDKWYIKQMGGNIGALMSIAPYMMGIVPSEFVDAFIDEADLRELY